MNQLRLVCLSLTPNLRCVGFGFGDVIALTIPPGIEVIFSLLFIYLFSGPNRQVFKYLGVQNHSIWLYQQGTNPPRCRRCFVFYMGTVGHVVACRPRSADVFAGLQSARFPRRYVHTNSFDHPMIGSRD